MVKCTEGRLVGWLLVCLVCSGCDSYPPLVVNGNDTTSDLELDTSLDTPEEETSEEDSDSLAETCPPGWTGSSCTDCVRYVNANNESTQKKNGLSWEGAFQDLRSGIESARLGRISDETDSCQVWVAAGTYQVYSTSSSDSLHLASRVHLWGGFQGFENSRDARDPVAYETIISGAKSVDGEEVHVAVLLHGAPRSIVDGFTLSGADGQGVVNEASGAVFQNCHFKNINGHVFYNKLAPGSGIDENGVTSIRQCRFSGNVGMLIYNENDRLEIESSVFMGNQWESQVAPDLIFGGVENYPCLVSHGASERITIWNSTFFGNDASGHEYGAVLCSEADNVFVYNSLFWENFGAELVSYYGVVGNFNIISSNLINDVCPLAVVGCALVDTSQDPCFVDEEHGDLRLCETSPFIDAGVGSGSPPFDMEGNPRLDAPLIENTGTPEPVYVDLGAYEYQPE